MLNVRKKLIKNTAVLCFRFISFSKQKQGNSLVNCVVNFENMFNEIEVLQKLDKSWVEFFFFLVNFVHSSQGTEFS